MSQLTVHPGAPLRGRVHVPGDKSIAHRALLLGALAQGTSQISGFPACGDCLATLDCLQALGIEITPVPSPHSEEELCTLLVQGRGLHGLQAPTVPLNCVRSGTTMRLLTGILAGQPLQSILTGDPQLLRRPMRRVVEPLRRIGAEVRDTDGHAPLTIRGRQLCGGDHTLPVASAQVKSALLLAGLYADGPTVVRQPGPARDHTERMLAAMGAPIAVNDLTVILSPPPIPLSPLSITIPGDFSSAAFLLVAATLVPGSEITIENVGVNPTRTGLLDVLQAMGADITLSNAGEQGNEPVAEVTVRASELRGVQVRGETVVRMIDEFPVLAVAATQAHGITIVRDAAELRVKESDRIATVVAELRALGARIEPLPDGFLIEGPTPLYGTKVDSHNDHRLAMALAVAGLIAEGETVIEKAECIEDSFPGFVRIMRGVSEAWRSTYTQPASPTVEEERLMIHHAMDEPAQLVGLIGWPVEHSLSPAMHNAAFAALGMNWHYGLLPTPPGTVQATLSRLKKQGYRGANVTVPHKQAVIPYMDEIADSARAIGAVNTIVIQEGRLIGHNTDADGFLAALREAGFEPAGRRALVLGAGGGARAVVYALARAGCSVTIYNRTVQRAAQLAHHMQKQGLRSPVTWVPNTAALNDLELSDFDLLVNATSVGMWPQSDASPWPETLPMPSHWAVYDLVYNPPETRLLAQARAAGARAVGGLGMLIHQGALAFKMWTGVTAPIEVMRIACEPVLEIQREMVHTLMEV